MKLTNIDIGLSIIIDDKVVTQLIKAGRKHYPREFGGLLVGSYSEDRKTVAIVHTILPKKYASSKYSFERGVEGLREKLENYYSQIPPVYYVGEWHTHPDNPAVPSYTDCNALQKIVNDENVSITNPILLIISIKPECEELCFYVVFKKKIYKYEEVQSI